MKSKRIYLSSILALLMGLLAFEKQAQAQVNVQDSTISSFILYVAYAYQFPGGDLAERYGNNSTIGPGVIFKDSKNWMYTLEANFIFGSNVKNANDIIKELTTNDGFIIGLDGTYVNYRPMERGFTIFGKIGKVFPAFKINPNSGLFFNAGLGYIQHKIRWDVEGNNAPQLDGDYKKGYDRFTEGFSLTQSFGIFFMSDSRMWNFRVSGEVIEGFTKTKRYNFDTYGGEPESRFDLYYGFKVSWMIPLFGRAPKAMYYY
jgi:hypothetical protein